MLTLKDPWLTPYKEYLQQRLDNVTRCCNRLTDNGTISLSDFANGHQYFGLHRTTDGWVFREWAPNATAL